MQAVHVLVDLENNQPTLEDVKRLVPAVTHAWLFHSRSQVKRLASFAPLRAEQTPVPISRPGKNALDFHLSFYVGYIASRNPGARIVIVAIDRGYRPMIEHAVSLGFDVTQVPFKPGAAAPAKKAAAGKKVVAKKVAAKKAAGKGAAEKAAVGQKMAAQVPGQKAAKKGAAPKEAAPKPDAGKAPTKKAVAAKVPKTPVAKKPAAKTSNATGSKTKVPRTVASVEPNLAPKVPAANVPGPKAPVTKAPPGKRPAAKARAPQKAASKKVPAAARPAVRKAESRQLDRQADRQPDRPSKAPARPQAQATPPAAEKVLANLRTMGEKQPKKLRQLRRYVSSMLGTGEADPAVGRLVDHLVATGFVRVNGETLAYGTASPGKSG